MRPGENPERKGRNGRYEGPDGGDVDPAPRVAKVADDWPPYPLRHAVQGGDDGALRRGEADSLAVVGQGEDGDGVAQDAEKGPCYEEVVLWALEQVLVEGHLHRAELLVPVLDQHRRDAVDDQHDQRQDAKRPGQAQVLDHGVGRERVDEPAHARPAGPQAVGERATLDEPLRDHTDRCHKGETHAEAKGDALGEDELPHLGGEGGADECDANDMDG